MHVPMPMPIAMPHDYENDDGVFEIVAPPTCFPPLFWQQIVGRPPPFTARETRICRLRFSFPSHLIVLVISIVAVAQAHIRTPPPPPSPPPSPSSLSRLSFSSDYMTVTAAFSATAFATPPLTVRIGQMLLFPFESRHDGQRRIGEKKECEVPFSRGRKRGRIRISSRQRAGKIDDGDATKAPCRTSAVVSRNWTTSRMRSFTATASTTGEGSRNMNVARVGGERRMRATTGEWSETGKLMSSRPPRSPLSSCRVTRRDWILSGLAVAATGAVTGFFVAPPSPAVATAAAVAASSETATASSSAVDAGKFASGKPASEKKPASGAPSLDTARASSSAVGTGKSASGGKSTADSGKSSADKKPAQGTSSSSSSAGNVGKSASGKKPANGTSSSTAASRKSASCKNPSSGTSIPRSQNCSKIELSDLRGITSEVNINVTSVTKTREGLLTQTTCEIIDRSSYTKVKRVDAPWFVPEFLRPKVVTKIPNSQLLLAGIVAGSATEIARISVLYPLDTVKSRIQADRNRPRRVPPTLRREVQALYISFLRKWREGDLYAGIIPAVLVSVPASGVYCGIRDVTKRIVSDMTPLLLGGHDSSSLPYGPVIVSILGATVADVASLAVRTPADVLALRLQVGKSGDEADIWEALRDGYERLPVAIKTDLPYLLSRVALSYAVSTEGGWGRYEAGTIAAACACAFLTTPFDVARTRILVDNVIAPGEDLDERRVKRKSRRRDGVLYTMAKVAREGAGEEEGGGRWVGVRNLFAGSIERTLYFGIGRAWLDPIRLIGYVGIRDAVLLRWFN